MADYFAIRGMVRAMSALPTGALCGDLRGRRFELAEACIAGADLLVEPAYAVAPAQFTAEVCCHCLRVLSAEERGAATAHRCGLCDADETIFCSKACKERWGCELWPIYMTSKF